MENNLDDKKVEEFIKKVQEDKDNQLDLSSDEDLSIAIMNLISIEEHFFFTGAKTGKPEYYNLLSTAREMRKELLKRIIKDYEGEVWCISKHLLSASMRLMEVGTKALGQGKKKDAEEMFKKAYELYSLFWSGPSFSPFKPLIILWTERFIFTAWIVSSHWPIDC